jgi:restriction endonuclease S subunit
MTDWPVKTLGDLLEVSIGGIWGSEAGEDEVDVFVYRSTELIKDGQLKEELTVCRSVTARQLDSRKLEEGDLLLEKSGGGPKTPVGRVGLVKVLPGLSVCSNFMQLMRPRKKEVLPVYLHYFLNHFHVAGHTEDLQNNSTNIRNLKTTEYMEVEVPVPPLEEQKRIVALLDSATARITELTACYEQARTHAKNLFTSALRDALESDPDWPVKTLGEVCEVARGTSITRKETKEGMIPVVAGGIDVAYFHSVQNRPAGTITISSSGANAGFVNRWDVPIFASDCSTVVAKKGGMVFGDYTFRFLQFKQSYINAELRRGAAQPHVYAKDIAAIEIPVPPLEEQEKIVARLDSMKAKTTEMVAGYDAKLVAAKNLRQSILEAAFGGDL